MIVLSNTTEQTLQPGQSLIFNETIYKSGNCECHRKNTGSVKLTRNCETYSVTFGANIDGATADAPVQLSIQLGGATLPETTMISAASGFNNVSRTTLVGNSCGDYSRITVVNTGTIPVVVGANSSLTIIRESQRRRLPY